MQLIRDLEPKLVWKYFEQICQIPRPSKHESKIIDYLLSFGNEHGLKTKRDAIGNILIKKEATKGFSHLPTIILQSHMDMVCEKNSDIPHDFYRDPITTYIDGQWVKAKGTTLGADDGIGMASQLALLASVDIPHGTLECLFTVDEETGLSGASALEKGFFTAKTLINLDSEDEGEVFIGCAGGIDTVARFDLWQEEAPEGTVSLAIDIKGLVGGHSGDDIHKGLGNANKILARFLFLATQQYGFRLAKIDGGNLRNAIAREAHATGTIPVSQKEPIRIAFNLFAHDISEELKSTEPNLKMTLGSDNDVETVLTLNLQEKLIASLMACPHGAIEMSRQIEGLVETSTNLASVKMNNDSITVTTSQRSSVESAKHYIAKAVESVFVLAGANVSHSDGYPGWAPNIDSKVLNATMACYQKLFNEEPKVKAIHAGLECGLFLEKYPDLDMISFGPTIKGAHSPDERLDIASVSRYWSLLCELVKGANGHGE
ncbi:MAG: aminoacyl-histidine dipeptidase [Breznakibacter sp.]